MVTLTHRHRHTAVGWPCRRLSWTPRKREKPRLFFTPSWADPIQFKSHACQSARADLFPLLQLPLLITLSVCVQCSSTIVQPSIHLHLDMQSNNSDFSTTLYPTHRSLRHFPRNAPSQGPDHTTLIIIIAISASVGGLLLTALIWRIISRLSRPKSAPLPPRQSLVHQREVHLAAFTEFKDGSVPQILASGSYIHEEDETTLDSSHGVQLRPPSPQFFPSHIPPSGSSSSLPSSNDHSAPSSGVATPPGQFSSPSQSSRRPLKHSGPRPLSAFSVNSRQNIRAAPHAPHSNVQIVLPAPLAPSLYEEAASDDCLLQRRPMRNGPLSVQDSWRRSLADSWILVGQDCLPNSEPMGQQYDRDSMERPTRLLRRMFVAFSMISILDALFPKEDPPRGHVLREVNPTHHRPPAFVHLRGWTSSRKIHIPQCRGFLLNLGHFLDTAFFLPLHPHGKEYH